MKERMKLWLAIPNPQFKIRVTLLLIVTVGFLLRLPGLDRDLSFDEAMSPYNARGTDNVTPLVPNGTELTNETFRKEGQWRELLLIVGCLDQNPPYYLLRL